MFRILHLQRHLFFTLPYFLLNKIESICIIRFGSNHFLEAEICVSFAWGFGRRCTDGLNRNFFHTFHCLYFLNIIFVLNCVFIYFLLLFLCNLSFLKEFQIYFLIERKSFYNVVLASATQQHKSAIILHVSPPFPIYFQNGLGVFNLMEKLAVFPIY